jgi:hypothetical protein
MGVQTSLAMIWSILDAFPDGVRDPTEVIKATFHREVPDSVTRQDR